MNLFFSPPIKTYSALIPHYEACQKVDTLISTGYVQFQLSSHDDSNDPFFIILSRIRNLKNQLIKCKQEVTLKYNEEVKTLNKQQKIVSTAKMKEYIKENHIDYLRYLDIQESIIQKKLQTYKSFSKNYDRIYSMREKILQQLQVVKVKLEVCGKGYSSSQFVMMHGICKNRDKVMLQRMLFRKSRGYSYVLFKNRQELSLDTSIFVCFLNKNVHKHIGQKIKQMLLNNDVSLFDLPDMQQHLRAYQPTLIKKLAQVQTTLQLSAKQLAKILHQHVTTDHDHEGIGFHLARICYLERIISIISHSKHVGNPPNHVLLTMHIPSSQQLPPIGVPFISYPHSRFKNRTVIPRLQCLQETNILTQLYSIPKYNEILPSIFMFATVPVLFGMMFSDIGHGIMLLSLCFWLKTGPLFYLMGFMSIYCGMIYNQFFGMKIVTWSNLGVLQPIWGISQNGLNFENSLKMKISMIVAFFHMMFGMLLKVVNQIKRKQHSQIWLDSLPKIGLLVSTVGYLVLLIVMKWLTNYTGKQSTAPSIINSLLQLYLGWNPTRKYSIFGTIQREHYIGSLMLMVSTICILIMLYNYTLKEKFKYLWLKFTNPKKFRTKNKKIQSPQQIQLQEHTQLIQEDDTVQINLMMTQQLSSSREHLQQNEKDDMSSYYKQDHKHSQLGPLQVFQYVLSLISSTTSYLRLFALSLAHSKLSHLLLGFLLGSLSDYYPTMSILRCVVFFISTCGLMLALDVMQCMMHVVRLHWVEWMGKFYEGSGVLFHPQIQEDFQ